MRHERQKTGKDEIIFTTRLNNISTQVSKERGEQLAIEYGIKFMETSAKASINVEEAFFTLARDIKVNMEKRLEAQNPPRPTGGFQPGRDDGGRGKNIMSCLLYTSDAADE